MLKKILTYFHRVIFRNWEVINYTGVIYNIVQKNDDHWEIEISFFLTQPSDKKEFAILIPLYPLFTNYQDAFRYVQLLGPMFNNTITDVVVVDKDDRFVGRFDLSQPISTEPQFTANTTTGVPLPTHEGNYTLN